MSVDLNSSLPFSPLREFLVHPDTRAYLVSLVRRRVPQTEVPDLVQTVVCDALSAGSSPQDPSALRPWLTTIARRRIADFYRGRRVLCEFVEGVETGEEPADVESRSVARFLLSGARDEQTLDWLVRTGEGEKLEHIAGAERLPPTVVRQRVSRLRRWLRDRWQAELIGAAVLILALGGSWAYRERALLTAAAELEAEGVPLPAGALEADFGGTWMLARAEGEAPDLSARTMLEAEVGRLAIQVERGRIQVRSPKFSFSAPLAVRALGGGKFSAMVDLGAHGRLLFRMQAPSEGRLELECVSAPWRGTVGLRQQR